MMLEKSSAYFARPLPVRRPSPLRTVEQQVVLLTVSDTFLSIDEVSSKSVRSILADHLPDRLWSAFFALSPFAE